MILFGTNLAIASDQWPMYQANPSHTGYVPIDINVSNISFRWKRQLGVLPLNPVTAANGRIFVSENGYFNIQSLYVLSKRGELTWSKSFADVYSVNPPSYANGMVYIQVGNHAEGTYIYSYDIKTGNLIFKSPHKAQWENYFSPTIYKGHVYINGGYYGGMYSYDEKTGTQDWFSQLPQYDQWTPSVDEKWTYAYVGEYSPALYVIDRLTGQPAFNIPDPNFEWDGWSMNSTPVLDGADGVFAIHNGRLIKFDTKTRKIAWQQANNYTGQVTIANNIAYAISSGALAAVNQKGYKLWMWETPLSESLKSNIIATNSHLFVSSETTTYCIDLKTHRSVWSYPVGGHLSIAESTLYIADDTGALTALRLGLEDIFVSSSVIFVKTPINTSISRTIKIRNLGDAPLTIGDIILTSPNFKIETMPAPYILESNKVTAIDITFTPTSATISEADLTIKSSDKNEPTTFIHLIGRGL